MIIKRIYLLALNSRLSSEFVYVSGTFRQRKLPLSDHTNQNMERNLFYLGTCSLDKVWLVLEMTHWRTIHSSEYFDSIKALYAFFVMNSD